MKKLFTLIILFHWTSIVFAQSTPPLERIISIKITNERLDNTLKSISNAGSFSFSYNPDEIEIGKRVLVNAQKQSVREVLSDLFGNSATFKNRGNYIILKKADEEPKKDFFVMGYVSDGETGLKIEKASVYEPVTLASAVTNQYGYYRLKLSNELTNVNLLVRKQSYQDGAVAIKNKQDKILNISLVPIKPMEVPDKLLIPIQIRKDTLPNRKLDSIPVIQIPTVVVEKRDTVVVVSEKYDYKEHWNETKDKLMAAQRRFTDWLITNKQNIHLDNIQDTIYRPLQISFLPFVGTNHYLSGNVINDFSLNIIAGYSLGVRTLEVGGILNIVRGKVNGVQAAGFANLVGQDVKGIQAAGFANVVGRNFYGLQGSGFANVNFGSTRGIQGAGFSNLVIRNFSGIQGSGFANVTLQNAKSTIQGAGFANIIGGDGSGVQGAGFANMTIGNYTGVQASGGFNFVGGTFKGVQVSTVNFANKVYDGLQIGVVNFANESNSIPIGVASFVSKGGYQRLEISTDEVNIGNVTFKTGVKRFYNIFTAGYNFNQANKPLFSYGYGLGTAWRFNRFLWANLDIVSSHLQNNQNVWRLNQLTRASLGLEFHFTRQLALFVAPTLNFLASQDTDLNLGKVDRFKFFEKEGFYFGTRSTLSSWFGYQAGIRICSR